MTDTSDLPPYLALHTIETTCERKDGPTIGADTQWTELFADAYRQIAPGGETLWVLVHLDNRVLWGYHDGQTVTLAEKEPPTYMQEARLFGTKGEYYLWRTDADTYHARLRLDEAKEPAFEAKEIDGYQNGADPGDEPNAADEWQVLWGDKIADNKNGWTTVQEGSRGIRATLPIFLEKKGLKSEPEEDPRLPLRLLVRHYLTYDDDTGICRYTDSRLVEIRNQHLEEI